MLAEKQILRFPQQYWQEANGVIQEPRIQTKVLGVLDHLLGRWHYGFPFLSSTSEVKCAQVVDCGHLWAIL